MEEMQLRKWYAILAMVSVAGILATEAFNPGTAARVLSHAIWTVEQMWDWMCAAGRAILEVVRSISDWER